MGFFFDATRGLGETLPGHIPPLMTIAPAGPDFVAAGLDFEAAGPDFYEAAKPDFSEAAGPDFSEAGARA